MNRLLAFESHVNDSVHLIDEKNRVHIDRNRGHLASCNRSDEVRLFLASGRAKNRPIMPRHQRLDKLSFNDAMVIRLADQVHVDQEILVVDGNFDPISLLHVRQSLGLSHSHGNKPWLHVTGIHPCLSAPHFQYSANDNAVPGNQLMVSVIRTGSGSTH